MLNVSRSEFFFCGDGLGNLRSVLFVDSAIRIVRIFGTGSVLACEIKREKLELIAKEESGFILSMRAVTYDLFKVKYSKHEPMYISWLAGVFARLDKDKNFLEKKNVILFFLKKYCKSSHPYSMPRSKIRLARVDYNGIPPEYMVLMVKYIQTFAPSTIRYADVLLAEGMNGI